MNSKRALEKTKNKFTNLIDGSVKHGVTVAQIIDYYEGCKSGKKISTRRELGNIEQCFMEEQIRDWENEARDDMEDGWL